MKQKVLILIFIELYVNILLINGQSDNLKIISEFFGDYYYKLESDTGILLKGHENYQKLEKNSNAFGIRRFNVGFEHKINSKFSGNLLLEGHDSFTLNDDKTRGVYIKFASLTYENIIKNTNITFGAQRTPTFTIVSEKIWGYRSIEKNITDFRKYAHSSDMGISINSKLTNSVNFYLMLANGEGTKIETNLFKKLYTSIYGSFLNEKIIYQLNYDFEKKKNSSEVSLLKFFTAYANSKLTLGLEPFICIQKDTVINKDFGMTFFLKNVILENKLNSFFRFDVYEEKINNNYSGYRELMGIVGIDYKPDKRISIMPNIWSMYYFKKNENIINRKPDIIVRLTVHYKI